MNGAIPPLPNTPSWHGAQLKHRDKFALLSPKHIFVTNFTNSASYLLRNRVMRYNIFLSDLRFGTNFASPLCSTRASFEEVINNL
jgi:hypothetical protein